MRNAILGNDLKLLDACKICEYNEVCRSKIKFCEGVGFVTLGGGGGDSHIPSTGVLFVPFRG